MRVSELSCVKDFSLDYLMQIRWGTLLRTIVKWCVRAGVMASQISGNLIVYKSLLFSMVLFLAIKAANSDEINLDE